MLQLVSICFIFIHFLAYAGNGVGSPGLRAFGDILDVVSQLSFVVLLIVLSKGWTITKNTLTGRNALLAILAVYGVLYLVLYIWAIAGTAMHTHNTQHTALMHSQAETRQRRTTSMRRHRAW